MGEASLNLREQIVRVDRAIAETQKFQEQLTRLRAEGANYKRDRFLAPWLGLAGAIGGIIALVTFFLRLSGR